MRACGKARLAALALASALAAGPATPQEEAVGPCSPYRAADGDVPSEMPGCAGRRRPAPGSLDDELTFRRRQGIEEGDTGPGEDAPMRGRPARRR